MQADLDKVRDRTLAICQHLETIRKYAYLPDDEFWSDIRNIATVKIAFIQIFQDMVSVCVHLSIARASRVPFDYPECLALLSEVGILPTNLSERLASIMPIRDSLIYRYQEVDDNQFLEYARHQTTDIEAFLEAVRQALNIDETP